MFGIGMPELIIILFVALIVIGPNKLPELAKSLGRAIHEFKKATQDITDTIDIKGSVHPAVKPLANLISHEEPSKAEAPDMTTPAPAASEPDDNEKAASDPAPPEPGESVVKKPKDETPADGVFDGKD